MVPGDGIAPRVHTLSDSGAIQSWLPPKRWRGLVAAPQSGGVLFLHIRSRIGTELYWRHAADLRRVLYVLSVEFGPDSEPL